MKWALITGSTAGIGKEFFNILLEMNYNIVSLSRNTEVLSAQQEVAKSKEKSYHYLGVDLSKQDSFAKVESFLEDLNLEFDLLINNAGFGVPGEFVTSDTQKEIELSWLQVQTTILLTKYIAQKMEKRKSGYILNVSSLYAFFPIPKQAVYGAVKQFLHSFSLALHKELISSHIYVSSLCPGLTYSEFRTRQGKVEKKSFMGLEANYVAHYGLRYLFLKKPVIIPGLFNKFVAFLLPKLPLRIGLSIIYKMNTSRGF